MLTTSTASTSGTIYLTRLLSHRAFVVSNISFVAAGIITAIPTLIRFGIYTRSGSTFTLVARTDSDTTIFDTANTKYTRALSTTGGYPATYSLTAGAEYWISVIQVASTAAAILSATARQSTAANSATGAQLYSSASKTDLSSSISGIASANLGGFYAEVS